MNIRFIRLTNWHQSVRSKTIMTRGSVAMRVVKPCVYTFVLYD